MKRKFKIVKYVGTASQEVVFSYPNFTSLENGLEWIRIVLDPYLTGEYGIGVDIL